MQFAKVFLVLIIFFSCSYVNKSIAQDLLKSRNLSTIRIDQMSDSDLLKYQDELFASGLTEAQAEQLAQAKGLPASEIAKLRQRLVMLNKSKPSAFNQNKDTIPLQNRVKADSTDTIQKIKPLINPKIFGSELFNNSTLSSDPNTRIATPMNYELGPDDQVEITVFGVQEVTHDLTISQEGSIYIPNVGQVKIAGLSIEAATQRIKDHMARTAYPTLRSGSSKLALSLGNIKSIKVTVIGANRPGNYTLSSLATVFNALFMAGGPTNNGSFREIELIRNNKLIQTVDLYRFLVNGDQTDNISLRNNDVIRIPSYKVRVDVEGYVKRPGFFEVLPQESFEDVLKYASGFADSAYRAAVKITQFTARELKVKNLKSTEFALYKPLQGDQFVIDKILIRYANRVNITGAVFRPGVFELDSNMTVKDLISNADGIREDAFISRGQIFRLNPDLTKELVSFNVLDVINNGHSISLKREDSVVIKSIFDLRDESVISVQGEVRNPGFYDFSDNLTVKDLIFQSGGLTDAAYPQRIEVARLIKRDTLTNTDVRASEIIDIRNISDLSLKEKNLPLHPFDVVSVRRKPGYLELQSVTVTGELQYPGPYVLSKREERVSDLIKRAGGFTPEAYVAGAYIKRYNDDEERKQLKKLKIETIQNQLRDTSGVVTQEIERDFDQIPLNVEEILKLKNSPEDVVLQPRDELIVPKFTAQVRISGKVLFPTQIPYQQKYNVKDYISAAGGISEEGKKGKIYVLHANGKAQSTHSFLFFRNYPSVKPGTEIIVPMKSARKNRLTAGETIGIASALASLAGVVIAILR